MSVRRRKLPRGSFRVNGRGWVYLVLAASVAFAAALKGNNLLFAIFCVLIAQFLVTAVPTAVWIPMAGARKRVRTTSYGSAPDRGWSRLGPFTVVSEFPPGLFTYRVTLPVVNRLLVYPRLGVL